MALSRFARRRVFLGVAFIVVASLFVWWGLWSLAAAQYRKTLDGWIDTNRAAGYQITYDGRSLFGFPRRVVFRFSNLHWRNADGVGFHAASIDIGATPWAWHKFHAKFKGPAEIDTPLDTDGQHLVLAGENGTADVNINDDGVWTASHISMRHASLGRFPDYLFSADQLDVEAERPQKPPVTHKDVGLTLGGIATNILLPKNMPSSFGPKIAKLELKGRVMDTVPDFRWKQSIDAWNKDSGVVEFDKLLIEWGPLQATAKGTMGFDDDLQPEGAFSSTIGHHDQVLKALAEAGFIAERQEVMLESAMSLFAKPSHVDDIYGIEVPIAVQLGGLFLGPVKIFSFPEIVWPDAPAKP